MSPCTHTYKLHILSFQYLPHRIDKAIQFFWHSLSLLSMYLISSLSFWRSFLFFLSFLSHSWHIHHHFPASFLIAFLPILFQCFPAGIPVLFPSCSYLFRPIPFAFLPYSLLPPGLSLSLFSPILISVRHCSHLFPVLFISLSGQIPIHVLAY